MIDFFTLILANDKNVQKIKTKKSCVWLHDSKYFIQ